MSQNRLEGCLPIHGDRWDQGGLKPTAVLIRALEINLGWQIFAHHRPDHRLMAHAGIKPDIEDIVGLFKFILFALRADKTLRDEILDIFFEPGICPGFADQFREMIDHLRKQFMLTTAALA